MARLAGLAPERWRSVETGSPIRMAELAAVAKALAVDPGTFLQGKEQSPRRSMARFRAAMPEAPGLHELRTLAMAAELGRIGGALSRQIDRPLKLEPLRRSQPPTPGVEPWKDGYRLGELSRQALGIPPGPIPELQTVLEKAGIHIAVLDASELTFEAAALVEKEAMPVVLLREIRSRPLVRRSAMAHELCHLLYDSGEYDLTTRTKTPYGDDEDPIEQRARAFAPAFLAPRDEVRAWFQSGEGKSFSREPEKRVRALAKRWGLSWTGAVWHAKNCTLIRHHTAERLVKEPPPQQEWRDAFERDDRALPSSLPTLPHPLCRGEIARRVATALERGLISEGRAKEILSWGP